MKSNGTAALKYLTFKDWGLSSENPGCILQYSKQLSLTFSMRSLLDHPIRLYFLHILGRLSRKRHISSVISFGKVRLSFLILSLLQQLMICANEEEMEMDKEEVLKQCFELVRLLGQGSFGQVYLIRNKQTRKEYALKRYNRNHIQKKGKYRSLIRSIFILQSLKHPNIITFSNYILTPDTIYLLFQPCKKGSLDKLKPHLLKNKQIKIIKFILYQLALALCYLKNNNIAHRDLKPSNITFNTQGFLKIIDFDEAVSFDIDFKKLNQSKMLYDFGKYLGYKGINVSEVMNLFNSKKSRASNYVGTQLYMSPEMVHSIVCDQMGDLWAYGCIFYQLFVGDYLHIEFDTKDKFQQMLNSRLDILKQKVDQTALNLFRQIAKYNPKERIQIQEVVTHQFFDQIRKPGSIEQCRQKLKQFLRGNYGIISKSSLDICEVEVIGMKIGKQIFQMLRTVILLKVANKFQFLNLYGGPIYLKLQYLHDINNKFYIRYDSISGIERRKEVIVIGACVKGKKQQYQLKHLYPQMLQNLYLLLTSILND